MDKSIRNAVRVFAIKDNKIVCIKYKGINDGYFDLPGGKIESGETDIETCIREFKEETGMNISDLNYMGKVTIIYPAKIFALNVYATTKIDGKPQDFPENSSEWLPIADLVKNEKRLAITHLLDDDMRTYLNTPGFDITFTCSHNHEILDININHAPALKRTISK